MNVKHELQLLVKQSDRDWDEWKRHMIEYAVRRLKNAFGIVEVYLEHSNTAAVQTGNWMDVTSNNPSEREFLCEKCGLKTSVASFDNARICPACFESTSNKRYISTGPLRQCCGKCGKMVSSAILTRGLCPECSRDSHVDGLNEIKRFKGRAPAITIDEYGRSWCDGNEVKLTLDSNNRVTKIERVDVVYEEL